MASISTKLELILKALSISRGRAAAEMGVDKPLMGRWVSGVVHPSARNLERLTSWIATYKEGFSLLDWDLDIAALAARFGVPVPAPKHYSGTDLLGAFLAAPLIAEASDNIERRGWAYEGLWRITRPSAHYPGRYVRGHMMMQRSGAGTMKISIGAETMRRNGHGLLLDNQMFMFAAGAEASDLVFGVFNLVARLKAEVLDGIVLTRLIDSSGSPVAATMLLERVGDLSGHIDDDLAAFDALCAQNMLLPDEAVPDNVRHHLCRDFGPTAFAQGGDMLLIMKAAQSMSRGPLFELP